MRIARPITPRAIVSRDVFDPRDFARERERATSRAAHEADVLMARNLRRSRALARRGGAR